MGGGDGGSDHREGFRFAIPPVLHADLCTEGEGNFDLDNVGDMRKMGGARREHRSDNELVDTVFSSREGKRAMEGFPPHNPKIGKHGVRIS